MSVSKDFKVVVATASDGEKIALLARKIWHQCYPSIISLEQIDYMLDQRCAPARLNAELAGRDHRYWLIVSGELAVAYGELALKVVDQRCQIQQIYVDDSVQGLGLGRMLLDTMIKEARSLNALTAWLTVNRNNASAIKFYRYHGFSQTEICVTDIGGGFVMDDYLMEKSILGADGGCD